MTLRRRPVGAPWLPCASGCMALTDADRRGHAGAKEAVWLVAICGRDTPLCTTCARNWRRWWDAALGAGERERVAA